MARDLAFFVQNNYVTALTVPVALYARAHGIALEDRSSNTDQLRDKPRPSDLVA